MIPRQECNRTPFVLFAVFLLVFAVIFSSCTVRKPVNHDDPEATSCISHGWPQDTGDLSPDPALVFGSLANGVRYVIKHNREPKGRVALYLDVQAGSLNETDQQRGLAHYLEHMVFNGTSHFPPGTLIRYFQSIGMSFGADTNAHTSYDETVYKLLLPTSDDKTLDEGMLVLADYARRALLLESEIKKERGVILSEKRARDSAGSRIGKNLLKHEFFGTRVVERDPIGVEQTLLAADSKRLRAFYDAWYRPENMIVVLVGDVGLEQAKKSIADYFSGLHAAAVRPKCYDFGHIPEKTSDFFYQYEPDLGKTEITLAATWNIDPTADTIGKEKLLLQNYLAAAIVNDRLQHMVNETGSPLARAQAYSGTFVRRLGYFVISGQTTADKWRPSLTQLEHILRQTTSYGVTEQELARVGKELQAELDQAVQTEESRDSSKLAAEFIRKLNDNEVILSPVQEKKLYTRLLGELTVADIHKALLRMNTNVRHVVGVAGTVDLRKEKSKPEDILRRTFAAITAAPVQRWSGEKVASFPYLSPPAQQGKIEKIIDHPAIGMTTTVLQNGIRINVKKTLFKEHEALLTVNFGHGKLSEPAAGLDKLAEAVVAESGVGRLTKEQLETALAGRNGQVRFSVGPESFRFSGKGLSSELELMLQLVYTSLADPVFRPVAYTRSMKRFHQMYQAMQGSVDGTYRLVGDRFFAGDNSRYGYPPAQDFFRLTLEQVRRWLSDAFAKDQLEISVVGDVDPVQVVALVRKYFGARKGVTAAAEERAPVVFPAGREKTIVVNTAVEKAVLALGWPTDDFWDISRTRRVSVLASLLEDRLRRTIREELGAAYSPMAYNAPSRVDRGYGVLRCLVTVDPRKIVLVRKKTQAIAAALASRGADAEELQRIVAPILTSIRDLQRTNRYWLEMVLALSSRHPEQLQWPLTIGRDYASITPAQINSLAARYLRREKEAVLIVRSKDRKQE